MSVLLLLQPSGAESGVVAPGWTAPAAVVLWNTTFNINGLSANQYVMVEGVSLTYTLGNRTLLRCRTIDPERAHAGAYRPQPEQSVILLKKDGTVLFNGNIQTADETVLEAPDTGVVTEITAIGYESAAESKYVSGEFGGEKIPIVIVTHESPARVQTQSPHGYTNGDDVTIEGTTGGTPSPDGTHKITVVNETSFTIPVPLTTPAGGGTVRKLTALRYPMLAIADRLLENGITVDPAVLAGDYIGTKAKFLLQQAEFYRRLPEGDARLLTWLSGTTYDAVQALLASKETALQDVINAQSAGDQAGFYYDYNAAILKDYGYGSAMRYFVEQAEYYKYLEEGDPRLTSVMTAGMLTGYAAVMDTTAVNNSLNSIISGMAIGELDALNRAYDYALNAPRGPRIEKVTLDGMADAAVKDLAKAFGWVARYTPNKVLEMFPPGTKQASFSLSDSNIIGQIDISKTREKFGNRVIVRYGGKAIVDVTENFVVGAGTQFILENKPASKPVAEPVYDTTDTNWNGTGGTEEQWRQRWPLPTSRVPIRVFEGVQEKPVTTWGTPEEASLDWSYRVYDNALVHNPFTPMPPAGTVVSAIIAVQGPRKYILQDDASVNGPLGPREVLIDADNVFDKAGAKLVAEKELARALAAPARTFNALTAEGFELPGTVIVTDSPKKLLDSAECMILGVEVTERQDGTILYNYSLVEGTSAKGGWVDYFKEKFGGGGSGGSSSGSSVTVAPPVSTSVQPVANVGHGTAGRLAVWVSADRLGDSKLATNATNDGTDAEGNFNVLGQTRATSFQGTGTVGYAATFYNNAGVAVWRNPLNTQNTEFLGGVYVTGPLTLAGGITTPPNTNLVIAPTGDLILNPGGKDVLPNLPYDINLGMLNKKYLTLHAAELWVETLVAQQKIATIGGNIIVAPTNTLIEDFPAGATFFKTKYNNFQPGSHIYMATVGKVEFMQVASNPSPVTGGYQYAVLRDRDGSGMNDWFAGDAIVDTSNAFIDIYSVHGLRSGSQVGPTIVGNVRNSVTYNDWSPRWAIGNLNGLYEYSTDIFGAAFGVPTAAWLKIDPTYGVRLGFNTTVNISIGADGNATFAGTIIASSGNIGSFVIGATQLTSAAVYLNGAGQFCVGSRVSGMDNFWVSTTAGAPHRMWIGDVSGNATFAVSGDGVAVISFLNVTTGIDIGTTIKAPNIGSGTGGTLIIDASGFIRINSSSERYKENVRRLYPEGSLLNVHPIVFDYKDSEDKNVVGFSAEELAEVIPALVNRDSEGRPESIREHAMIAYLLELAREHEARINQLEAV